ncbi:STM3941 family protein [Flavobacterium sp.]|uniref:STM3941 family protein n=1 Tax=Flavobacterium sp. TaxID=239 RepID=UPI00122B6A15|nr:STM3941 family protein [Flavobacterium sp.]RZJ69276.1 MAG: hypothetical protein EOO49_18115 [Flavobacterium sp.]
MQNLSIKKSIWKALSLVLTSSALVAMGVFILLENSSRSFVGWINVIFFSLSWLVGMYQLFDRRPQLIADENGFFDRMVLTEPISWSAVESIRMKQTGFIIGKQIFAEVVLKPFSGENIGRKIKKRLFTKAPQTSKPYVVNVTLSPLEGKPRQTLEALRTLKNLSDIGTSNDMD